MLEIIKLYISLIIFWILLTVSVSFSNLVYGMIFSGIIAFYSYRLQKQNKIILPRLGVLIRYSLFLVVEILLSSVRHIGRILKSQEERIVFIEIGLRGLSEFEAVMAANFITLTPGTVTVNLADHRITVVTMLSEGEDARVVKNSLEKIFSRIFGRRMAI
ncbi:MAG: hypothetical protein AVO33_02930 [delta proteobacterium ML8_F1]|nr:MAG: hypothetical protein AVO33_02930 [delta proteobacterium ML8_F1]